MSEKNLIETNFEKMLKVKSDKIKKKQKQSYINWAVGWGDFKKLNPDAEFEVVKHEGKHYYSDDFGIMVETSITVGEETHNMWMPVLDGANNAMKKESYTYKVKKYVGSYPNAKWDGKSYDDKMVQAVTMFDINTALMRCFVKNMGLFGYGLHLYQGEEYASADVISMAQLNEITAQLNDANLMLHDLNNVFQIQKLTELLASNFSGALQWIEDNKK